MNIPIISILILLVNVLTLTMPSDSIAKERRSNIFGTFGGDPVPTEVGINFGYYLGPKFMISAGYGRSVLNPISLQSAGVSLRFISGRKKLINLEFAGGASYVRTSGDISLQYSVSGMGKIGNYSNGKNYPYALAGLRMNLGRVFLGGGSVFAFFGKSSGFLPYGMLGIEF